MPANRSRDSNPPTDGPWGPLRGGSSRGSLSYGDVDAEVLRNAVAAITRAGNSVMLSLTSDGGAFCVGLYSRGKRDSRYFTSVGDLQEALDYLSMTG